MSPEEILALLRLLARLQMERDALAGQVTQLRAQLAPVPAPAAADPA